MIAATGGEAYLFGFFSGAALAALSAAATLPIRGLALVEPAIDLSEASASEPDLGREITDLVDTDRRADAIMHFNRRIGVREEMNRRPAQPSGLARSCRTGAHVGL